MWDATVAMRAVHPLFGLLRYPCGLSQHTRGLLQPLTLCDTMITIVFRPKVKNMIRPPPTERNLTQDAPDTFKVRAQTHVASYVNLFACNLIKMSHRGFS